jgi:hypothetical protein
MLIMDLLFLILMSEYNTESKISREHCENRNDPDFVQAFLMKWWVESDFKAPNLPFHYGSKFPAISETNRIHSELALANYMFH